MTYLHGLQKQIEERYPKAYEDYLNMKAPVRAVADLARSLEAKTAELEELKRQVAEKKGLDISPEDEKILQDFLADLKAGKIKIVSATPGKSE